jgi:hypothetical protein
MNGRGGRWTLDGEVVHHSTVDDGTWMVGEAGDG